MGGIWAVGEDLCECEEVGWVGVWRRQWGGLFMSDSW